MNNFDLTEKAKGYQRSADELAFIMDEMFMSARAFMNMLFEIAAPTDIIIMSGAVVDDGAAPDFTITAGYAFHNGEVFVIDAAAFTAAGGETAVFVLETTDVNLKFQDTATYKAREIRKLKLQSGVSGSGLKDYDEVIRWSLDRPIGEVSRSSGKFTEIDSLGTIIKGANSSFVKTYDITKKVDFAALATYQDVFILTKGASATGNAQGASLGGKILITAYFCNNSGHNAQQHIEVPFLVKTSGDSNATFTQGAAITINTNQNMTVTVELTSSGAANTGITIRARATFSGGTLVVATASFRLVAHQVVTDETYLFNIE